MYPLPFFALLTVPPFLACGAPIRSSIILSLLTPVAGLEGGAEGGLELDAPALATPRPAGGAGCSLACTAGEPFLEVGPEAYGLGVACGAAAGGWVTLMGGVAVLGRGGTGGVSVSFLIGGAPEELTARDGGPFGGGGVAAEAAGVSPPFLLTHFFSSLS